MSYSTCSHCGGYSSNSSSYSALERVVGYQPCQHYDSGSEYSLSNSALENSVKSFVQPVISYLKNLKGYGNNLYLSNDNVTRSYHSAHSLFLNPDRKITEFVGDAIEIEDYVREAFRLTMDEVFPDDLTINLCDREELKRVHASLGGVWSDGINGFAVNKKKSGLGCSIFVLKDELARVMLTVGHEIGHCVSLPLSNSHDEEAKAFAFELAWVETIRRHDIADLASSLVVSLPAVNGLHNVAFDFVRRFVHNGMRALDLCFRLVTGELSVLGDSFEA